MDDEFRIRCDVEREPLCGERFRKENKNREKNKKRIKEQITSNKRVIFTEAVGMEEIFTAFVLPDILPCQAGVVRV